MYFRQWNFFLWLPIISPCTSDNENNFCDYLLSPLVLLTMKTIFLTTISFPCTSHDENSFFDYLSSSLVFVIMKTIWRKIDYLPLVLFTMKTIYWQPLSPLVLLTMKTIFVTTDYLPLYFSQGKQFLTTIISPGTFDNEKNQLSLFVLLTMKFFFVKSHYLPLFWQLKHVPRGFPATPFFGSHHECTVGKIKLTYMLKKINQYIFS